MCFFMEELVEMVNKTNSRLLYEDLVTNIKNKDRSILDQDDEEKYQLLNVFEMLWNVDPSQQLLQFEQTSHDEPSKTKNIKGHALTVKEEYLDADKNGRCKLIDICERVRKSIKKGNNILCSFLDSTVSEAGNNKTIHFPLQGSDPVCMLMLNSEQAEQTFIKAIDHSLITNWEHFEYILSFIIENRLLRIYLAYSQN